MEKITFHVNSSGDTSLLPLGGKDKYNNLYQADRKSLLINGRRVMPVMGELHFSRLKPYEWKEAILKMQAGGINILSTYVFWNHHEERQNEWDFTGCRNLKAFLEICKQLDMKVWLRIGPWAHGECRHGGFPDYVQYADFDKRTNTPQYLKLVEILYRKIAEQSDGMMCKDGGPVIGIQIENEYGHCGGPSDKEEQKNHMKTLLQIAKNVGLIAPYYTATAWGGACTIDETLQVLSGYVDAPWDSSTEEIPVVENYLFIPYRDDTNTGSDFHRQVGDSGVIRKDYPYLTAELGGGLQVTSHRRVISDSKDNEAHIVTVLGAGASLIGYYMYHGGINPQGRYSSLNESQTIGGYTNLPQFSYDFDGCINQAGKLSKSYGALKKYHHLLATFGGTIAESDTILPDILPENAEDMSTIRAGLRWNAKEDCGFLFINNHVRNRIMMNHNDVTAEINLPNGSTLELKHLNIKTSSCMAIPINLKTDSVYIRKTNASLLCSLGERVFLYTDEPLLLDADGTENITVLSTDEANRSFLFKDGLCITEDMESCIINDNGTKKLISTKKQTIKLYRENGSTEQFTAGKDIALKTTPTFICVDESLDRNGQLESRTYKISMNGLKSENASEIYLNIDMLGDRAEVLSNGMLIDDWFTTGKPWNIKLSRFDYPDELLIKVYDSRHTIPCCFGQSVYYDLPVNDGCEIRNVALSAEQISLIFY